MKSLRSWGAYGLLLAIAAAGAIAARTGGAADSPIPSVENPGADGVRALFLYLQESGHEVRALHAPLTELPPLRTVVLVAPTGRKVSAEEVASLERFVTAGGTLVYLSPRPVHLQPELARWLGVSDGPALRPGALGGELHDLNGATVSVRLASGAVGASELRVCAEGTVRPEDPRWLPVASGGALWWRRLGSGEIWLGAGPDLAQNTRLELLDNVGLWASLAARGPIGFDEVHHQVEFPPPFSTGLLTFGLQFAACFAMFAMARGARLGPPRPELVDRHRSTREYLESLANLMRRARVERELVPRLIERLRLTMQERLGIPLSLPERDAALELERQCRIPAAELLAVTERARLSGPNATPGEFAALAREVARIERVITGRT